MATKLFAEGGKIVKRFKCSARASNMGHHEPQECDWPHCGCDEAAPEVISALIKEGWAYLAEVNELKAVAEIASQLDVIWGADEEDEDGMDDAQFNETLDKLRIALRPYRIRRQAQQQLAEFNPDSPEKS